MHFILWVSARQRSFPHAHELCISLLQGRACCGGRCREEIFRTLHSAVEALGLQDCWKAKPLLTGKEVILPYVLAELSWLESGLSIGAHQL